MLFPKETEKKRLNKADIFKEMCANSNIQQVSLNDLHPKMEYGSAVKVVVNVYFVKHFCSLSLDFLAASGIVDDVLDDKGQFKYMEIFEKSVGTIPFRFFPIRLILKTFSKFLLLIEFMMPS